MQCWHNDQEWTIGQFVIVQSKLIFSSGIHINYISESSAGRVSLITYLPGLNLDRPDKSGELKKE